jgi:hypothetical protein
LFYLFIRPKAGRDGHGKDSQKAAINYIHPSESWKAPAGPKNIITTRPDLNQEFFSSANSPATPIFTGPQESTEK